MISLGPHERSIRLMRAGMAVVEVGRKLLLLGVVQQADHGHHAEAVRNHARGQRERRERP